MSYHQFRNEDDEPYGSFEAFYRSADECMTVDCEDGPGWYWWACFAGCLPDGDPVGPFETEQDAIDDAREL